MSDDSGESDSLPWYADLPVRGPASTIDPSDLDHLTCRSDATEAEDLEERPGAHGGPGTHGILRGAERIRGICPGVIAGMLHLQEQVGAFVGTRCILCEECTGAWRADEWVCMGCALTLLASS